MVHIADARMEEGGEGEHLQVEATEGGTDGAHKSMGMTSCITGDGWCSDAFKCIDSNQSNSRHLPQTPGGRNPGEGTKTQTTRNMRLGK